MMLDVGPATVERVRARLDDAADAGLERPARRFRDASPSRLQRWRSQRWSRELPRRRKGCAAWRAAATSVRRCVRPASPRLTYVLGGRRLPGVAGRQDASGRRGAARMSEFVIPAPPVPAVPVRGGGLFPVRRIFCVGRNYAAHAREMGHDPDREPPFFFTKPADAIVAGGEMPYPTATSELHHEVELVVAIGAGARHRRRRMRKPISGATRSAST